MSHDANKVHFLFTVNDLFLLFIVEVGLNSGFVHDLNLILNLRRFLSRYPGRNKDGMSLWGEDAPSRDSQRRMSESRKGRVSIIWPTAGQPDWGKERILAHSKSGINKVAIQNNCNLYKILKHDIKTDLIMGVTWVRLNNSSLKSMIHKLFSHKIIDILWETQRIFFCVKIGKSPSI